MTDPLVSIGLPVFNGAEGIGNAARTVLAQGHEDLELIISDNCSTDGTEEICRALARTDPRVRYHRQRENVGLLNNFTFVMRQARGRYFKWIGDDDRLEASYLARSLERFAADERIVLVTTQQAYLEPDGVARTAEYHGRALGSARPVERFGEMLRLLNDDHRLIDPLYGLTRRDVVTAIPRRNMLREDQVFAAKLALAGPWAHVPEVLAQRSWADDPRPAVARLLDVPLWQVRVAVLLQCRELVSYLRRAPLSAPERHQAYACVAKLYLGTVRRRAARRARRLVVPATATARHAA